MWSDIFDVHILKILYQQTFLVPDFILQYCWLLNRSRAKNNKTKQGQFNIHKDHMLLGSKIRGQTLCQLSSLSKAVVCFFGRHWNQRPSTWVASLCDSEFHLSYSLLQSWSHKCLHLWHNYFQNQLRDVKQKIMTSGNE